MKLPAILTAFGAALIVGATLPPALPARAQEHPSRARSISSEAHSTGCPFVDRMNAVLREETVRDAAHSVCPFLEAVAAGQGAQTGCPYLDGLMSCPYLQQNTSVAEFPYLQQVRLAAGTSTRCPFLDAANQCPCFVGTSIYREAYLNCQGAGDCVSRTKSSGECPRYVDWITTGSSLTGCPYLDGATDRPYLRRQITGEEDISGCPFFDGSLFGADARSGCPYFHQRRLFGPGQLRRPAPNVNTENATPARPGREV